MKKDKQKKNNLSLDIGTMLLIAGGLANVTMWIGAFSSTEARGPVGDWINMYFIPILGSVSGFAMGITAVAGLVFVLVRFASMRPTYERKLRGKDETKTYVNYRYWMTVAVLALLLIVSWALLSPFAFAQISGAENLYEVLGDKWARWWSAGRIIAADLVLGGIALVTGVHPGSSAPTGRATDSSKSATDSAARSGEGSKSARKSVARPADLRLCEYGCGMTYRHPNGRGGHMKRHHPDLCVVKGTPAHTVLPISSSQKSEK